MTDELHCALVLPFLNEEETLLDACSSLGFGGVGEPPTATTLFLVDNGSTDRGGELARQVQRSATEAVVVVEEPRRGHVRARGSGNLAVGKWATRRGMPLARVLVLQIDADTRYCADYVESMRAVAVGCSDAVMIEGTVGYPAEFTNEHAAYFRLREEKERALRSLFADEIHDCVADDKVAGYRLDSYFGWGGHRQERDLAGDEIYAETTRLFIAARAWGARRTRADGAHAWHSPRRLLTEPLLHTACAGIPRGAKWREQWLERHGKASALVSAADPSDRAWVAAWEDFRTHLLGFFLVLPVHVGTTLQHLPRSVPNEEELVRFVQEGLPTRTRFELRQGPGVAVADALAFVDDHGTELLMLAERAMAARDVSPENHG